MAVAGRLASAVGYLWLLLAILSGAGVLEDLPLNMTGSGFYAVALIFLGRALRKRSRTPAEGESQLGDTAASIPTPPVLPDVARSPSPEPAGEKTPVPAPSPAPRPATPQPEPIQDLPSPSFPVPPVPAHKSSRDLIEDARARWGKKP